MMAGNTTKNLDLSVIVPVYNEEACVEAAVIGILKAFSGLGISFELIVVDDGSTDETYRICRKLQAKREFKICRFNRNRGYSNALLKGFLESRGTYIAYLDADLQYTPSEIIKLFRAAVRDDKDFVIGTARNKGYGLFRKVVSRTYNLLVRVLFSIDCYDVHCKRVFRRDLIKPRQISGLYGLFDLELLLLAIRNNAKIKQIHIQIMPRMAGRSKLTARLMLITLVNLFRLRLRYMKLMK